MKKWEAKSRKTKRRTLTNAEKTARRKYRAEERNRLFNDLKKQMQEAAERAESE